jgi:hypothetical protein
MVIVLRLSNTCKFMVFRIISGNTCSKRFERKGKLTQGHWQITNFCSQMFLHVNRSLYPLQILKTKSSRNCCYVSSSCFLGFVELKIVVITNLDSATLFFPGCWLWFISKCFVVTILVNFNYLFFVSKRTWATSIWVFMGVMLFNLLYLISFLRKIDF